MTKLTNINQFDELVTIVFIAEGKPDFCFPIFRNVLEQIYKNVQYIIVHRPDFQIEEFRSLINEYTLVDITTKLTFVVTPSGPDMFNAGLTLAEGEVIFLKASDTSLWHPTHILSHMRKHRLVKYNHSVVFSYGEYRNPRYPIDNPFGAAGYRISNKINGENLILDEISVSKDIKLDFKKYGTPIDKDGNPVSDDVEPFKIVFDKKKLYSDLIGQAKNINMNEEMTLVLYLFEEAEQRQVPILTRPNWSQLQTVQGISDDLDVIHRLPTIFGNGQIDELWNNQVRIWLREHWEEIVERPDRSIIIKRTVGMGDVICAEPIVRYFKEQGFKIWFVTSDSRSCKLIVESFASKVDQVLAIPEFTLTKDWLGENNLAELTSIHKIEDVPKFDIRLDLDLAYESRSGENASSFVESYFQTLGFAPEVIDTIELNPKVTTEKAEQLLIDAGKVIPTTRLNSYSKSISVCLEGSGWQSKELNLKDTRTLLQALKSNGYGLISVTSLSERHAELQDLFDHINSENDFSEMMIMIRNSRGYVGADNGPMHIAAALGKEIFVWNGAALTDKTSPTSKRTVLVKDIACIGCKHKLFFNIMVEPSGQQHFTFVPQCQNPIVNECMTEFESEQVTTKIEEYVGKLVQIQV